MNDFKKKEKSDYEAYNLIYANTDGGMINKKVSY